MLLTVKLLHRYDYDSISIRRSKASLLSRAAPPYVTSISTTLTHDAHMSLETVITNDTFINNGCHKVLPIPREISIQTAGWHSSSLFEKDLT